MSAFPRMIKVRQVLNSERLDNPAEALAERLIESGYLSSIKPGARVAVTAGSRGIHGIDHLMKALVSLLREHGAQPFIVATMGSHGGGTVSGQLEMLESLGIDESTMGVSVQASENAEQVAVTESGVPVFVDRLAIDADAVIVMNRIKIHTAYHGAVESGLSKMVAVGLGKKEGAETCHRYGLGDVIVDCFREAQKQLNIICGIALLENANDEILDIAVAAPNEFERIDSEFLERSRYIVPGIPLNEFDILIVDEMGKNISGTGMDTNVVGFWRRFGGEKKPDYSTLIVSSLTAESHGNAMGIGLADLTNRRLTGMINYDATYANAMTSQWSMGRIPITLENDRACVEAALTKYDPETVRIVRIKNTLELAELAVSEALADELSERNDLEIAGAALPMAFDDDGFLV